MSKEYRFDYSRAKPNRFREKTLMGEKSARRFDGEWYIAYCPEIPGANGQGKTKDEARASLAEAIGLVLDDRRADALRGIRPEAELDTVTVK